MESLSEVIKVDAGCTKEISKEIIENRWIQEQERINLDEPIWIYDRETRRYFAKKDH